MAAFLSLLSKTSLAIPANFCPSLLFTKSFAIPANSFPSLLFTKSFAALAAFIILPPLNGFLTFVLINLR